MLLPLTVKLEPTGALIMFAGIYYGAMYGGSTTTILLNTPGESASIATALEGNKMAKRGRAGPALATAGHRLVRRRNDRHDPADAAGAAGRRGRAAVRPDRVLCADGVRVRHGGGGARILDGARTDDAVPRPAAGSGRHRRPDRADAFRLRRARADGRHRCGRAGCRPVRGRRGTVRRGLPEPAARTSSSRCRARS